MNPMMHTAIKAAREAGRVIGRAFERSKTLKVSEKGRYDFTTEIDHQAEEVIVDILHQAYPKHSFLCEERGEVNHENEFTWIIDPLDGTSNFMHQLPHFAISIALSHKDKITLGVIYDPIRDELFCATRNEGGQLDQKRLRISEHTSLAGALIGTGFPMQQQCDIHHYLKQIEAFYPHVSSFRSSGCATLDLAYVASGRLDGFFKSDLKVWDVAAGALMVREAKGLISDYSGGDNYLYGNEVVAANPKLLHAMVKAINAK